MNFIKELTVAEVALLISTLAGVGSVLLWLKKINDRIHDKLQEQEEINKKVLQTEKGLEELRYEVKKFVTDSENLTLFNLKNSIFTDYLKYKEQGYIKSVELENFSQKCNMYFKRGGNGVVRDKYYPEINRLEVRG